MTAAKRATLLELADRCEQASGPDRELDERISIAVEMKAAIKIGDEILGNVRWAPWNAPKFTSSLDAALSLVPEGWKWSLHSADDTSKPCAYCVPNMGRLPWPAWVADIEATTPSLALCAAALRALAAVEQAAGEKGE